MEEKLLVKKAIKGDEESFCCLMRQYQNYIYQIVRRQLSDDETAVDLTQEIFVKAYKGIRSFRQEAGFKTWLTRIAVNSCNSYFTSRRFRQKNMTVNIDGNDYEKLISKGEDEELKEKAITKMMALVNTLKPIHREVITLCTIEKKTYREAGEILGIPEGTVSSRMSNALVILKDKFFKAQAE